jgi:hypothetical protein
MLHTVADYVILVKHMLNATLLRVHSSTDSASDRLIKRTLGKRLPI